MQFAESSSRAWEVAQEAPPVVSVARREDSEYCCTVAWLRKASILSAA
jgi:hypothetical protein